MVELFCLILLLIPVAVIAENTRIEEVVVTAQRRAESVQEVPISINAFDAEGLTALGIHNAQDIMKLVPNSSITAQGGSKYTYIIRGVGSNNFHLNDVGAVGVYLDDVGLNSPFQLAFSTMDQERVEVMRGPQNTLFGRNTTGGAVNYISRKPRVEDGLNGYLEAGYGRFDQVDLEGAVGFALSDNTAVRVAASSNTRDGVFQNITTGEDVATTERQAARAQLLWEPAHSLKFLINVHGGVSRADPVPIKNIGLLNPNDITAPCPIARDSLSPRNNPNCVDSLGINHQYNDWEDVLGGTRSREDIDQWGASLNVSGEVGSLTVTSLTAYDSFKVRYNEDTDGAPTVGFQFNQQGEYDQWSQELRIQSAEDQRLRWIAGLFYFFEEAGYVTAVRRIPAPLAPSGPNMFNIIPNTLVDQDDEVISGYGQVELDIQDTLTATVGLRYTDETKDGYNRASVRCAGPNGGPPFCPPVNDNALIGFDVVNLPALAILPTERLEQDFNEWGARFALDWKVSDAVLLYTSASRGFKSGGFSIAALQALQGLAAQPVDSETLWAYEVGVKSSWLDNTLQLNAAGFYYDWKDLQSFQSLIDPVTSTAVPQLLNVPKARVVGGEVEWQWLPAEGLLISGGVGILDSEIRDPGLIAGVSKGNKLLNSPELTFTGMVRKEFMVGPGTLALQTNWRFQDDVTFDLANASYLGQSGYWLLNARASYRFGHNDRYEIVVWGENLTATKYVDSIYSLEGLVDSIGYQPNLSEPTYGIKVAIHFE